jgi:hypothetical protein
MNYWSGGILLFVSLVVAGFYVAVSLCRDLTALESVLLQLITLALGTAGSFVLGNLSAQRLSKRHAKSAFRRVSHLYLSLSRLIEMVTKARSSQDFDVSTAAGRALDNVDVIVTEQIYTADDALEDWSDIVPEDLASFRKDLQDRRANSPRN